MDTSRFKRFIDTEKGFLPKVSIWRQGQIWFSSGAVNKFNLLKYNYIVLLYDDQENEIGFLFTNNGEEQGAIKPSKRDNGILIGAKNFMDCYEITYGEPKYYIMRLEAKPSLFVINLDRGTIARKRKQRKGAEEEPVE